MSYSHLPVKKRTRFLLRKFPRPRLWQLALVPPSALASTNSHCNCSIEIVSQIRIRDTHRGILECFNFTSFDIHFDSVSLNRYYRICHWEAFPPVTFTCQSYIPCSILFCPADFGYWLRVKEVRYSVFSFFRYACMRVCESIPVHFSETS